MKQALIDGIIVVHSRWRIVFVCFIQRYKKHIQLLIRQPFDTFAHCCRLHKVHGNQNLVAGVGAVQIQRAIKAQINRLVDEVNLLEAIAQQLQKLIQQDSAVRQGVEIVQHFFAVPVICRLSPDGDVKHLHHTLLGV